MEAATPANKLPLQLQRAKRRYKALLRGRSTLAASGKSDSFTEEEIAKLEKEYPELVPAGAVSSQTPRRVDADLTSASSCELDEEEETARNTEDNGETIGPSPRTVSATPPAPPSSQSRLRKSAPPSLLMQPPLSASLNAPPRSLSADAQRRYSEASRPRPPSGNNYFMIMFALQLFNERHQRSMMTPLNVMAIAVLSAAAAIAHCTVVDPVSVAGSLLSPSLLTLLVHANALCGVYVRRKRRFTAPMLVVYTFFDILPSLGLGIVCYNLELIALELYGFRRASSAC